MMEWMRHGTPFFDNWAKYARPHRRQQGGRFRRLPEPRADDLEARRALSAVCGKAISCSRASCIPTMRSAPIRWASTASWCRTTARRQLDNAPSPLEVLPAIRDAVGDKMTVMFDGGIRRGLDAIVALCMGAKFVFVGRPTLYGVTAGGVAGRRQGARHLPARDRPQHGADGRHQDRRPRPAVPDVEGRGGPAPQQTVKDEHG